MVIHDSNPCTQGGATASYQTMNLRLAWATQGEPISSVIKPLHSKHRTVCSTQSSTNKNIVLKFFLQLSTHFNAFGISY